MRLGLLASALVASTLVAGCDPEPFTLTVHIPDIAVVAIRDGDGEWKPVEAGLSKRAHVQITSGRYSLAWFCGRARAFVMHSTAADEPEARCIPGQRVTSTLSGTTSPGATVYAGGQASFTDQVGGYVLDVPAGYHDVIAVAPTLPMRAMVQRDVDLRGSLVLDLPVADEGVDMLTLQPRVVGPPQESLVLVSELTTRTGDVVLFPEGGEAVPVLPSALVVETDRPLIGARGTNAEGATCTSSVRPGDETPMIELPVPPVPILHRTWIRWASDLEWRYVRLTAWGAETNIEYTISATRDWMDAASTDSIEIPDLSLLPGWDDVELEKYVPGENVNWSFYSERGDRASAFGSCSVAGTMIW